MSAHLMHAQALARFIDRSPTPYHAVQSSIEMLEAAGFVAGELGTGFVEFGGSLFAWNVPDGADGNTPFRLVGAHTDSPNLRLKPHPDADTGGYKRLGVEVYGGVLLNSWLDRDLGISGRLTLRDGSTDGWHTVLVHIDEPICTIPQLAIHLDRKVNDGLTLNPQAHLSPIWGIDPSAGSIIDYLADRIGSSRHDVLGFDLMLHDVEKAALTGANEEFLRSSRLDNQLSCHAAVTALTETSGNEHISMIALFDHEEVGSTSSAGAATARISGAIDSIYASLDEAGDELPAGYEHASQSLLVSADNAHATHPNYPDRHDPEHRIGLNEGPVLKHNASQRYTTDAESSAAFHLACERAGVSHQSFVSRSDMPCGSTIGPTLAAQLGVSALDVGVAQLGMHSIRETCGSKDPWDMTLLLAELLH